MVLHVVSLGRAGLGRFPIFPPHILYTAVPTTNYYKSRAGGASPMMRVHSDARALIHTSWF